MAAVILQDAGWLQVLQTRQMLTTAMDAWWCPPGEHGRNAVPLPQAWAIYEASLALTRAGWFLRQLTGPSWWYPPGSNVMNTPGRSLEAALQELAATAEPEG